MLNNIIPFRYFIFLCTFTVFLFLNSYLGVKLDSNFKTFYLRNLYLSWGFKYLLYTFIFRLNPLV